MSLLYIKYEVEITNRLPTNTRYQTRISGPLLDRIDIRVEVLPVEFDRPGDDPLRETAATIRARLEAARERQRTVTYVAGMERSRPAHLAEAIQYRPREVLNGVVLQPVASRFAALFSAVGSY